MKHSKSSQVLLLALIVCLACFNESCITAEQGKAQDVDIVVWNNTGARLINAYVAFPGFRSLGGPYAPGIKKTDSNIPTALPDKVTVMWITSAKVEMTAEVDLQKMGLERFSGKLFFIIQEDGTVLCKGISFPAFRSGQKR